MRTAVLASIVAAALGFAVGRFTLGRQVAQLEARARRAELERDAATDARSALVTVEQGIARAERVAPAADAPIVPGAPGPAAPRDEISELMSRLNALMESADLGGQHPEDMGAAYEETARKVRDEFFDKAQLNEAQRAAIAPIVTKLDAALDEPLTHLAALENADHYAVSEWSQAHVDVYRALATAEESLRAQLSPQQREQLDQSEFSLASQLGVERYEALVGRGLFPPTEETTTEETTTGESPPVRP